MNLKFKKTIKRVAACLIAGVMLVCPLVGCDSADNGGSISSALDTIAQDNAMAKSTLKGGVISFDATDFARATNLSSIDSITITKLPPIRRVWLKFCVVDKHKVLVQSHLPLLTLGKAW